MMKAFETTGIIDAKHKLRLDNIVPINGPSRVKVIILVNENDDISEEAWLKMSAKNPVFKDLNDEAEDIYSIKDGKPFNDYQ